MFLPTTQSELASLNWKALDIIFVTGDSYIDSPFIGTALLGKLLVSFGFRVGIIAQPDTDSDKDISRLGEPKLFWGITSGSVDSMVANYTASKKWRKSDDYTPGGINNRRPDRAVIAYTNLVKRHYKKTVPIVLGGIEASLRRICHYDFWSDRIRRSVLFDAKADFLLYGMSESSIVRLAGALKEKEDPRGIRGLCYISKTGVPGFVELPSFKEVLKDKKIFARSFHQFYANNDPVTAKGLVQKQDSRFLVQNPPAIYGSKKVLDTVYDLEFERDLHPYYRKLGRVKALDTIRFSIATHRGCYGECNFCAIALHEGSTVRWRSRASIVREAKKLTAHPKFKGSILDVGGPTANMYGYECKKKLKKGVCRDKRCLFPEVCRTLKPDHSKQLDLLKALETIPEVKKVFIGSGIRHDLILGDEKKGDAYLKRVVRNHVSGQMKVAPEHVEPGVLRLMGKPERDSLLEFKKTFDRLSKQAGKPQFLTYYFIAAHPGCTHRDMAALKRYTREKLKIRPEQVQIFTPTPSTYSTLMYYTRKNPFTGEKLFVEKKGVKKEQQKFMVTPGRPLKKRVKISAKKRH